MRSSGAAVRMETAIWARDDRALWRSARDFIVVLAPDDTTPTSLRGTGVALWSALEQPGTLADLAERLAVEFRADPEAVRTDLEPVIDRLADAGVIRQVR